MRRRTFFACSRAALQGHIRLTSMQYNMPAIPEELRSPVQHPAVLKRFSFCEDVQASVGADMELIVAYNKTIRHMEKKTLESARKHCPADLELLLSMKGIGKIIALTILYEIEDIGRFPRVQDFVSYARLVKCSRTSAGKMHGTGGNKMGNPYLKWIFSEAAIHMPRQSDAIAHRLSRLEKKHGKGKGKILLAHKIGRVVYFMLKNQTPFDEERFLATG
jgi:transposase